MTPEYNIEWLKSKIAIKNAKFIFFWGHDNEGNAEIGKFCFSQWFEAPFEVDGIIYKSAEHWMMAQKALLFNQKALFDKIVNANKPGEAKELGRQVKDFDETIWIKRRFEIVVSGNNYKFSQNNKLRDYLLSSKDRVLVEASPVDTIWGIGLAIDNPNIEKVDNWRGLNLLGFALMTTRDFLLKQR